MANFFRCTLSEWMKMGFSIHKCQVVNPIFSDQWKCIVHWSQRWRFFSGTGASGSFSACAFTQFITDLWLTFKCRPICRKFIPSAYIRTANSRVFFSYPCCFFSGVYLAPHSLHRYRWLPAFVNPSLFWLFSVLHFGHLILQFNLYHHPLSTPAFDVRWRIPDAKCIRVVQGRRSNFVWWNSRLLPYIRLFMNQGSIKCYE